MLTDMMADNDGMAQVIADAVVNSINDDTANTGLLHNFALAVRLRMWGLLAGIPIPLDAPGVGYIDGAYTGPLRGP